MIKADIHLHSSFSGDSDERMENTIRAAIEKGLEYICFTEHMDMDFPQNDKDDGNIFLVDTDSYQKAFEDMKSRYSGKITLLFGVEWGMQPHLANKLSDYVNQYPFDFIIASEHITNKSDPYYPEFYEGRSEFDAYAEYFSDIVTNLDAMCYVNHSAPVSSLGHLDYVVRYGPNKNENYSYKLYGDYLDEILKRLIDRSIALEVNTGGYKYNLGQPNPATDVIKRYLELGGELITIGSDAHKAEHLCYDFDRLESLLLDLGVKYYTVFQERKPIMLNLN